MARKNCTHIGGQAVLEGVMMRGKGVIATAVRDPYGEIQLESSRFVSPTEKNKFLKLPLIRGIVAFVSSMALGMKTLVRATEVYGDDIDEQPSRFEKWLAKTFKIDIMKVAIFIGVLLGLALAVGLFILAPVYLTKLIFRYIDLSGQSSFLQSFYPNLTASLLKLVFFVVYILLIGQMKDIKRLFRYHGAEHKTISAYENGLELNVENVQTQTTVHDRCGTTFMVIVLVTSLIVFSLFKWHRLAIVNSLIRLALVPVIMAFSYEFLKFFAKFDNWFVKILKAPGLLMQKLTTKEPDDDMVEVAIVAFNTVLAMEANESLEGSVFQIYTPIVKARLELGKILPTERLHELDLILMDVLDINTKTKLLEVNRLDSKQMEKAKEIATQCKDGVPLQYATGVAHFYGLKLEVNKNTLIPRQDSEILVEQVVREMENKKGLRVLDLCSGSGALALAIKKENSESEIIGVDIDIKSVELARKNAQSLELDVEFSQSDLFENVSGEFDIILSNPPYIETANLKTLDSEVKDYEPALALDGGVDGLDIYRKIAKEYMSYLKEDGVLFLEIGIGQANDVSALFEGKSIDIVLDYNNPPVQRVLVVRKEKKDVK